MGFGKEKEKGTDKSVFSHKMLEKIPTKKKIIKVQMLAQPIDKMTDIKNPITIPDEKPVIDVADDEDLEEGELTESDEENEVVQVATPELNTRETSHEQPTSN